jgi:hypothetical protein
VIFRGRPRPAPTRGRRLVRAVSTVVIALIAVESAARAYSAIRFRNTIALKHGVRFLEDAFSRQGIAPRTTGPAFIGFDDSADRAFESRAQRTLVIESRPPTDSLLDTHLAHYNNLGFRGRDIDLSDTTRRRIATFGGSDTFGNFLEDRETWPTLLDERLRSAGFAVDVINASGGGHNIDSVLNNVIALTNTAAIHYLVVTSAYTNRHLLPMERRFTLAGRLDWTLYNVSMAHVMLKEKLALLRRQPIDYGLYRQRVHIDPAALAAWTARYERRLQQIATIAREQSATLVLCTQGAFFQDARLNAQSTLDEAPVLDIGRRIDRGEDVWLSELEYFMQGIQNQAVRRFTDAAREVLLFDGASLLQNDKLRYFRDSIHPGPAGAAKLADAMAAFFTPLLSAEAAHQDEGTSQVAGPHGNAGRR